MKPLAGWTRDENASPGLARYTWTGSPLEASKQAREVYYGSANWTGATREELAAKLAGWDLSDVDEARKYLDEIADGLTFADTTSYETRASVCGARLSIGTHLAGSPMAFRRRAPAPALGPIRVIIDTATSAAMKAGYLKKRGLVVLALAEALQRVRPVELVVACGLAPHARGEERDTALLVPVGTRPVDIALACGYLAGGSVGRGWLYGVACKLQGGGEHRIGWPSKRDPVYLFGAKPDDVAIPGAHVDDPMVKDPVGFIRGHLERQAQGART